MGFDWDFVLKDCNGDMDKVRRRVEHHFQAIREEAANICNDYAVASKSVVKRQAAFACGRRILSAAEKAKEQ